MDRYQTALKKIAEHWRAEAQKNLVDARRLPTESAYCMLGHAFAADACSEFLYRVATGQERAGRITQAQFALEFAAIFTRLESQTAKKLIAAEARICELEKERDGRT